MKFCEICNNRALNYYFEICCKKCFDREKHNTASPLIIKIQTLKNKQPKCKTCKKEKSPRWYKQKTQCQCCYNKAYKQDNKTKIKEQSRTRRMKNKDKVNAQKRVSRAKNPHAHRFEAKMRKKHFKKAIPRWLNKTLLLEFWKNKPKGMQVDHIIPLNNNDICGLNVPWNLQYLTPFENNKKNNFFDFTYENEGWKNVSIFNCQ